MTTTKAQISVVDASKYLDDLLGELDSLIHGIDHVNTEYQLTPARHQCLTELSAQLNRIEQTLQDIAK